MSTTSTVALVSSPLFKPVDPNLSLDQRIQISYDRAVAIAKAYALTAEDVLFMTPKFWALHVDQIIPLDGAATSLLAIQFNLVAGTLAPHAMKRPELQPLLRRIMNFEVSAQFLLSEVDHGLDAPNLETTATLLSNGEFELDTPHPRAAKWMPPTAPYGGMPRVGIVFARLMVDGEDRGVRPFIVALGDGKQMCKGISARTLPTRAGAKPLDHAITIFNHVRLPATALLGKLEKPIDMRQNFLAVIWRVGVGSLALSAICVSGLKAGLYIAGKYSMLRHVTGADGTPMAIIGFRTQQLPILHCAAQCYVLEAYYKHISQCFVDPSLDNRVRHGLAATFKAVIMGHTQPTLQQLAERCGSQGLFKHNGIIENQIELRGAAIAEGDTLVLTIRLATELLIGRYAMPASEYPDSLLARHEAGLFEECQNVIATLGAGHRSQAFNRLVLPLCRPLVEAIGHRMAYEAAFKAQVDPDLLALYEAGVVKLDSSWYAEHGGYGRRAQAEAEDRAATAALPSLAKFIEDTNVEPYCQAPISSDIAWNSFVAGLPHFDGDAVVEFIPNAKSRETEARL